MVAYSLRVRNCEYVGDECLRFSVRLGVCLVARVHAVVYVNARHVLSYACAYTCMREICVYA